MKDNEAVEAVKEIRVMMEKSSRFLSFSGTSAILIGVYALAGAFIVHRIILSVEDIPGYSVPGWIGIVPDIVLVALIVFVLSLVTILFFSAPKARKMNSSFVSGVAYRTFLNFFLPLATGGVFCLALLVRGEAGIIAPVMLLFYGLSLINASKYTYGSIFWLGCGQLLLGLICAFFPGTGLLLWSIGFGVLHIIYGIYFYFRVERESAA
ncbi:hypothetical protein SAMN05216365_12532 [Porphyromonadaceae bacterium NLAE-zl-C104]|jgi:hypothetical protein|uniref:hypothetical protein n=1 Tax=Proteiniphilum saccharofermentans TaxID=1642647 RepID=UPI00089693E6|nr:hypothetical protein [Proteiniphilum saccharofermentans]SDZ94319.1 hypothetical protein SAMN05216331_11159 [Porphyromonadaceae bacterium KH3R12]SFS87791.1 hypothetical protein SAMN05216365_12532 [Porphyromonadaceae bacterium NLAE-zl-C104]